MSAIPAHAGRFDSSFGQLAGAAELDRRPANDCKGGRPKAGARTERLCVLYSRHRAPIFRRCLRLLRDRQAAEDATQETFLRVVRHAESVPPDDQALPWLYRIATNYCLNEIRDRRRDPVPAADLAALPGAPETAASSVEDDVADRELAHRILASLPERLRVVAVLRHAGGLYDAEVAEALGVARRTVVYRLKEVRRRVARGSNGLRT
jgi:RNA polymerase sigma-70 factor (ECF subfamily)